MDKYWTKLLANVFAKKIVDQIADRCICKRAPKIADQNCTYLNFMEKIVTIYREQTGPKILAKIAERTCIDFCVVFTIQTWARTEEFELQISDCWLAGF